LKPAGVIWRGGIAGQILAKSIIRRRSAPSHAALLGDAGLGWIIQSIDLVHLEGAALDEKSSRGAFIHKKYETTQPLR
jgi:hypothetical protein